MAQVMVNFRMEEELKKEMEEVCKELGLSITAAFTIFAKKMTREKRIPFEVSVDPLHTERSLAYMKAILEKYEELEKVAVSWFIGSCIGSSRNFCSCNSQCKCRVFALRQD